MICKKLIVEKAHNIWLILKNTAKILVLLILFLNQNIVRAQLYCENVPATGSANNGSTHALSDAIIIGVAIMIVIFTLIMSVKYLFKPGEKNPDHIKNIVKNEGF